MRNFIYQSIVLTGVFTHTLECLKSLNGYEVNASYLVKSPGAEIGTITSKITNTGALNSTTATIQTLTAPAITATSINNIPILSTQTTAVTGTGQTITALPTTGTLILIVPNNTTFDSANINFPTSPVDGQIFTILLGGINSSITQVNNSAATGNLLCTNPITTLSTNATATYVYSASKNTWYLASAFPNIDGGLEVQIARVNAGNTVTCLPNVGTLELTTGGNEIASATITFPPNPADNQPFIIISDGSITSLSSQGGVGGATAMNPPGGKITANGTITYIYLSDKNKWYVTSSYPTEGSITADSLTITGNLTVDGASALNDLKVKGNFTQTGDKTFTTGTGAVSLNGDTTVADGKTFNVGTGLTTLNGGLTIPKANNPSVSILTGTGTVTIESENAGNAITLNASKENGKIILNTTELGSIDLMGPTIIKDSNTFTVGTGATTLGGTLTVTGLTTLNGGLTTSGANSVTLGSSDIIKLTSTKNSRSAIEFIASDNLGGITFTGDTFVADGKTFTVKDSLTTLGGGLTTTGNNELKLNSGTALMSLTSTNATANAIALTANSAGGGMTLTAGSGNINLAGATNITGNTTVAGANTFNVGTGLTTLGGGLTVSGTANINLANTGTGNITLTAGSGGIQATSSGNGANAIKFSTVTAKAADGILLSNTADAGGITLTAATGASSINLNPGTVGFLVNNAGIAAPITLNSGAATINLTNTDVGSIILAAGTNGLHGTSTGPGANAIKFSTSTAATADGILLSNTASNGGITLTAATDASSINLNPGTAGFLVNNAGTIAAPITLKSGAAAINLTNTNAGSIILTAGTNGLHGTSTSTDAEAIKLNAIVGGILLKAEGDNKGITLQTTDDDGAITLTSGSHSANAIKLDAMGGFLNTLSLNSNGTPADAISLIASADTGGITLKSGTGNINMDGILLQGFQSTEVADAGTVTPINNKVRTLVLRTADGATIANATINFHANPFPGQYFTIVMGKGTITDIAINSIKDLNVAVTTLTTGTAVTYVYDGNISQWCFVC